MMLLLRRYFFVGVLAILCVNQPAVAAQVNIAAVVGDDIITTTDVEQRRDLVMATAGIPLTVENQQKITPRIVQSLVDETLELQEAKAQSLTVTDEELNKAIDSLNTRGDTKQPLREFIAQRHLSLHTVETQMRAQLAWNKVVTRKLRRNVSVAQDEVLRAQKTAAAAPGEEELRVQAMEIKMIGKDEAAATKLVDEIALQLKAGTDMASVAAHYLNQPAVAYNPPVWMVGKNLPVSLQQMLRGLKLGEVSPPVPGAGKSVQLIQLLDRATGPKLTDTTEYAIKQIAIALPPKRDKNGAAKLRESVAALRSNYGTCTEETAPKVALPTEVKIVRAQLNALSPQQRLLLSHLEVGDVSEPLPGPDAVRLIVMCEKTEPAVGNLPDAETIRQQLFAEKLELEAQKHLRNLRRDAYIDIKGASGE